MRYYNMINSHLHIWDGVWADEFKKMKEAEIKAVKNENESSIMVDNKAKKHGKK